MKSVLMICAMMLARVGVAATFVRPMERVSTMDGAQSRSMYDSQAIALVYETPLEVDYAARPYRLVPGYCELPQISADGLVYTFKTRTGAAKPMVDSLERLRDVNEVSPNGWMMKDVDTILAKDAHTVEIRLKQRCHFFSWLMAMGACAVRMPDGSGTSEFELVEWRRNHEMRFKRRQPRKGGFDEVRYLVVDDASTQWLMFLKGEVDMLGEISRDNWDAVVDKDGRLLPELVQRGVTLHSAVSMDVMHIGVNMKDPILGKNRKLRQALNAAFDHAAWSRFYSGRIISSDGPVPPGVEGRLESPFAYAHNLEKARQLMVEAGYPNGIDPQTGRRLVLTMSIGRASQSGREMGELIASFYERIGIKLELDFKTWDAFLKAINDGRVQLYQMGWVGDYPDAQNFLQLFYSKNISPGPNHSFYINANFDAEYDAAMTAPSAAERNRHWQRCQEIVREDCPWIFLHYNKLFALTGPKVDNFLPSVLPYGNEKWYNTHP